ncbi:MAG: hypothetical protein HW387_1323 [Parachlamydiales bacterium]|nr:hypothetical protein [Parachlamydiales bacterium]
MDIEEIELKKSEWIFGFAMLMFILSILWIAHLTSGRSLEQLNSSNEPAAFIEIKVTGCIKQPKTVRIPCGSQVRDCLKKIRLRAGADVSSIDFDQVLTQSGTLEIRFLEKIVVEIQGCVEQKMWIDMPLGSRICDLKERVVLSKDADSAFFKRRRRLKNNDIVCVPPKKGFCKASR